MDTHRNKYLMLTKGDFFVNVWLLKLILPKKIASGFKAAKSRVTVLLGGNAFNDFKMKLLLIHIAENPRAFKNCSKDNLPVIYKSNKKAWITSSLFSYWLTNFDMLKKNIVKKKLKF